MNTLSLMGSAFLSVCQPMSLLLMIAGVAIGIVFGSIPGLSASMAVALMLPITFTMEASLGMNVLVAVYIGGISGGLISAILLNMPGTASSIATTFDGHPMAQNGQAMKALGLGIVFSFLGSEFSFLILSFFAPKLADIALQFTPAENFGICFFALTMVAVLSSGNMVRGLLAGMFGLVFAVVGMSPIDGTARFTFGQVNLMSGFDTLTTLIGIFAVADILKTAE
ncbi:MAG: tripartite tricarboxylate transporter permease, partial [Lachnospiraceae bacterium]|nr:tripartite tricarboxylate transporter permease [Lachnospiraceae bacterium]